MKKQKKEYISIDEYIHSFPGHIQKKLMELRNIIKELVPEAAEKISYQMPAFFLNKNLVYFAGYSKHIGFYPGASTVAAFKSDLSNYKYAKGSIQFPIGEPLPVKLIKKIVIFKINEISKNKKMDNSINSHFRELHSGDTQGRYKAYLKLISITENKVDWTYEIWKDLIKDLKDSDNHIRTIAAQILCNLAKSDPENRISKDFKLIMEVTHDERFVTARHTLLAIWKIGLVGKAQLKLVLNGLEKRYIESSSEKNKKMIRCDIILSMKKLFKELKDEKIQEKTLKLIEIEEDEKLKKKYMSAWKKM